MKRLFCTVILALCMGCLSAQSNRFEVPTEIHEDERFVLDSNFRQEINYEYRATDSIYLSRGFFRHANLSSPHVYDYTMLLDVDGLGVYPPGHGEQGGPNNDDTGVVGALGGTVDVGAMGGATYTIPIELPAGINGMQPSLALTYNSQGGNGLLGWKWELSGLSSITRTGKTRYHDGVVGGVTLNDITDRFMLDGQRLIQVQDYTDSIEFKTEQDGLARIMAYMDKEVLYLYGDTVVFKFINNFRVWNPDGTILEYGFTEDSRIEPQNGSYRALCWLLNKAIDCNGNAIIYNYTENNDTGEFYIESIKYTMNESLSIKPEFTVKFVCSNKEDFEFGFIAGNLVQRKKLLDTIIVTNHEETEMLRYMLTYSNCQTTSYCKDKIYHRLTSVGLEKDGKILNPTRIKWEWDENYNYHYNEFEKVQLDTTNFNNFVFVGDFNADGFSDVITVPYKGKDSSLYSSPVDMNVLLNQGNGSFEYDASLSMNNANGNPLATNLDWIHVIDINDDGYDDIILHYYIPITTGIGYSALMLYVNHHGESFASAWSNPIVTPFKLYLTFGDFLGEGKQSSLVFKHTLYNDSIPLMTPVFYIHYENGGCITDTVSNPESNIANDIVTGDFDGNGRTEVLIVNQSHGWTYRLIHNESDWSFESIRNCFEIKYVPELNLFPGDFNGDGKEDLLCYGERHNHSDEREWFFLFSTGTAFEYGYCAAFQSPNLAPREKLYTYSLEEVKASSSFALFTSDFDGDGLCDIALALNTNNTGSLKVYSKFVRRKTDHYQFPNYYIVKNIAQSSTDVKTRSQYLHVGNFYNKDNMSFLGTEVTTKDRVERRTPVLCSLYSLHEYNSVTLITDGLGNETRMSYRYPAVIGAPRTQLGNGIDRVNSPMRTLRSVTEYKANNAPYTTLYDYENAAFHKYGHGYLGFLKQVVTTKVGNEFVGKRTSSHETGTMGGHAFSLPKEEVSEVYVGDEWRTAMKRSFGFRKVTCSRDPRIVKPAMTQQTSLYFNFDTPNTEDLLRMETAEYDYSFGTGRTYSNAYNCTETRTGIDAQDVGSYGQCEFKTAENIVFYSDNYSTWTLNRPHHKTVTQKRTGKPDVSRRWSYEFVAPDSYLIKRIYDNPMNISQNPLMTQTDFEYYEEGNLKKQTLMAPHGVSGEHTKTVEYEYGPGVGDACQHRLITKKTTSSSDDLSYETLYSYDTYDQVDSLTAGNGLVTTYETDPLGIYAKSINPDHTQTCNALRWVEENDHNAPRNALYLKWSRTSGSPKTLTYYHKTGVELRTVSFGLNGETIYVDKAYDDRGRLEKVSNPYHPGETVQWTCYKYDNLDRLTNTITPDSTETVIAYNGLQTTTTITPIVGEPQTSSVTANAMGWTVRSDDASGNSYVTYDHYADGLLAVAKVNNDATTAITATYDAARHRQTLADPNYGALATTYNAYGELTKRVSPKELEAEAETHYQYDGMGRLKVEMHDMESTYTRYVFDEDDGATKGTLKQIRHQTYDYHNIQRLDYEYDNLGRNTKTTETRPSGTYETLTAYDDFSQVSQTVYPTGVTLNYEYRNGYLYSLYDADYKLLWRTDGINALGQLTDATLGNGSTTHRAYNDEMHYLDSIVTTNNLQNLSYDYDKFGNLASRKDNLRNLEETFHYDKMNRLTDIYLGNTHSQIAYDPLGRMTSKQADGLTVFANAGFAGVSGPARPHAMKSAQTMGGVFPTATQTIAYTGFDKVAAIVEGNDYIIYTYGHDQQRIHLTESVDGVMRLKEYVGVCEFITGIDIDRDSFHSLTYLVGPFGVFAVVEKQGMEESVHYILKDHLGSWTTITDSEGIVEQELSYDAWGSLRNPTTWSGDFSGTPVFDRGFTGHEHLAAFGLINMNGRCYDPLTSSFLSVDAYVQDPTSAQSFNRYAYCMHNPLRYTDPTGWLPQNGASPTRQNNGANHNPEAYWYSNDLNDVLWGRSVHPCETGNPKSIACTSSGYTIGNALVVGGNGSLSQLQAIRAYQNNPNLMTSMALEKMGIDVTIGCTYCNYMGMDGFLASMYNWTDASGQAYYAQTFEYVGGDRNCFYITGNEPSSSFWNENLDIAGKMLSTGGTYTYVESVLHYSEVLGKWMDKQGKRRPLSDKGGKYIGGKLKYGKAMRDSFIRASNWFNIAGMGVTTWQIATAESINNKIKYGADLVFEGVGFAPGGQVISIIWFLGGRELVFKNGDNFGKLMNYGIYPGNPSNEPFK